MSTKNKVEDSTKVPNELKSIKSVKPQSKFNDPATSNVIFIVVDHRNSNKTQNIYFDSEQLGCLNRKLKAKIKEFGVLNQDGYTTLVLTGMPRAIELVLQSFYEPTTPHIRSEEWLDERLFRYLIGYAEKWNAKHLLTEWRVYIVLRYIEAAMALTYYGISTHLNQVRWANKYLIEFTTSDELLMKIQILIRNFINGGYRGQLDYYLEEAVTYVRRYDPKFLQPTAQKVEDIDVLNDTILLRNY